MQIKIKIIWKLGREKNDKKVKFEGEKRFCAVTLQWIGENWQNLAER